MRDRNRRAQDEGPHALSSGSTPPFEGLLAALRIALGVGVRAADIETLSGVVDWAGIGQLAQRHRVVSLALGGLESVAESHLARAVPPPLRRQMALRTMQQLEGLRLAADCLAERGIPSIVLKGLPLSQRLFGTPLARDCFDIDLLISPDATDAAQQALTSRGWQLHKPTYRPTPVRNRAYNHFVKDRLLMGPGGRLELHHRLTNNPFLLQVSFDALREEAATAKIGSRSFPVLSDADLLVYLSVHGQLHRFSRLKWLCDMAALLMATDRNVIEATLSRCRLARLEPQAVFGDALALCRESLHLDRSMGDALGARDARSRRTVQSIRSNWAGPRAGEGRQGVSRALDEARGATTMKWSVRVFAHEVSRLFVAPYDFGRPNLPDWLFLLNVPLRPFVWLVKRIGFERDQRNAVAPLSDAPPSSEVAAPRVKACAKDAFDTR